jgi:hypothetical protein
MFKTVSKISHIWAEYSDGINGHISVRELKVTWREVEKICLWCQNRRKTIT